MKYGKTPLRLNGGEYLKVHPNTTLSETPLTIAKQNDPIVDKDSTIKNGWLVEADHIDIPIILFTDLPNLKKHEIKQVNFPQNYIWPGDTFHFKYNDVNYTLYATGGKFHDKSYGDQVWYDVWNYKLYLSMTKNGMTVSQLIVAAPHYSSTMAEVEFIGDIDGDSMPDMIINTTHHYNVECPTLYLSKFSNKYQLLKIAGCHFTVGC